MDRWARKDGGGGGTFTGEKGAGRVPSASSAIGIGRVLNPQQFEWGEGDDEDHGFWEIGLRARPTRQIGIGRPLVVIPIYDGDSYDLEEFFHRQIQSLDKASGERVHLLEIGHPGQTGPVLRNLLIQLYGEEWERKEKNYVQRVFQRGIEDDRRREAMIELREKLQIPAGQVPCLAVPLPLDGARALILPIRRPWFSSDNGRLALGWTLREWFGSPSLDNVLRTSGTAQELAQRLPEEFRNFELRLNQLGREIERGVSASSASAGVGWAVSAKDAVLSMRRSGCEVVHRGRPVALTKMEFTLLWTLALRSQDRIPYEQLQKEACGYAGAMLTSVSDWARTHKFHIVKKIRDAFIGSAKAKRDLSQLIVSHQGTMKLNLSRSQIHLGS